MLAAHPDTRSEGSTLGGRGHIGLRESYRPLSARPSRRELKRCDPVFRLALHVDADVAHGQRFVIWSYPVSVVTSVLDGDCCR